MNKSKYFKVFDDIKIGTKFGYWKVINNFVSHGKNNHASVICICTKCNITVKQIRCNNLVNKKSIKCKTCSNGDKELGNYKGILVSVFNKMKLQAKTRNISFGLTVKYIGDLFEKQKGLCALSGLSLTLKTKISDTTATASLDRIDSSKGYLKTNVQWIHKDINKIKQNLDEEYFISLCSKIVEFTNIKR